LASDEIKAIASALRDSETPAPELRKRLIAVRAELFRRGIFDPILARLDSVTVARASSDEIADELDALAANLTAP
jgi:hypothetical protein